MEKLVISEERLNSKDPTVLISLKGTIETTNASTLEEALERIINEKCYRIAVDLSGVTYISSAGWGIFISEIKRIRGNGGDIKLAAMTTEVREVFDLLEFNNILKPYPTKDEALKAFTIPTGSKASGPGNRSSH
jgi:anti-sigma B factor antagonist